VQVLIVGSGGREHALAWKVAQSSLLSRLYVAPGNAGTAQLAMRNPSCTVRNIPILADDVSALVAFAREEGIDLVIIGPEAPLAAGLTDALRKAGIATFGPSRAAAQIEVSKAFAKDFMERHHIPTARYATFSCFEEALQYVRMVDHPVVVKASGLAAGKGVLIPENPRQAEVALRQIMLEHQFGAAGEKVVIEERLAGEEVSLLAFTDGVTVQPMPPAQDHKRLLDGDQGPNTGGMGAYAATPFCPRALVEEITRTVLQPAVDGLRAEGRPFVGVLYAGLMFTREGLRVLEFNSRFGDPETQVLLPLLDSDLLDIALACVEGKLSEMEICWSASAAACVVLASEGYPGRYPRGRVISGLEVSLADTAVFHAGTGFDAEDRVVTAGGRVLGVTGWGDTVGEALKRAYAAVGHISFEGMQYRRDIGARALEISR